MRQRVPDLQPAKLLHFSQHGATTTAARNRRLLARFASAVSLAVVHGHPRPGSSGYEAASPQRLLRRAADARGGPDRAGSPHRRSARRHHRRPRGRAGRRCVHGARAARAVRSQRGESCCITNWRSGAASEVTVCAFSRGTSTGRRCSGTHWTRMAMALCRLE